MKKNYNINFILTAFLLFTYIIINLLFINYIGSYAWDDGAITLAYGQTIAEYGKFALTGASEIVEGSSSIILTFLTSIVTKLFHFDFYGLITWSQINTLVFTVITLILTFKIIGHNFKNKNHALLITFLVGLFPMYTTEIMNGMEMTIFSTLLLLFVLSYDNKTIWAYLLIPLLLLARFESVFYLGFIFLALFMFDKCSSQLYYSLLYSHCLDIAILEILCQIQFGPRCIYLIVRQSYWGNW